MLKPTQTFAKPHPSRWLPQPPLGLPKPMDTFNSSYCRSHDVSSHERNPSPLVLYNIRSILYNTNQGFRALSIYFT